MVSAPARRTWWRFYTEMCGDLKIRKLTPAQRWIWCAVLSAARMSPQPGKLFVGEISMDADDLAEVAAVKVKDIQPAIDAMAKLHMLSVEDGVIVVTNWDVRQFESDSSADRTRAYRERHKARHGDDDVTSQPRHPERHSDPPETETETETEKESGARKRGTRIPDDFKPTGEDVAGARKLGLSSAQVLRETEKFIDYWRSVPGQKGVKLDWQATWRNWVRRAAENTHTQPKAAANSTFGGW